MRNQEYFEKIKCISGFSVSALEGIHGGVEYVSVPRSELDRLREIEDEMLHLKTIAFKMALSQLPRREKETIRLIYWTGATEMQVSKIMRVSQQFINKVKSAALIKLSSNNLIKLFSIKGNTTIQ